MVGQVDETTIREEELVIHAEAATDRGEEVSELRGRLRDLQRARGTEREIDNNVPVTVAKEGPGPSSTRLSRTRKIVYFALSLLLATVIVGALLVLLRNRRHSNGAAAPLDEITESPSFLDQTVTPTISLTIPHDNMIYSPPSQEECSAISNGTATTDLETKISKNFGIEMDISLDYEVEDFSEMLLDLKESVYNSRFSRLF
jgi:hypothetical protein